MNVPIMYPFPLASPRNVDDNINMRMMLHPRHLDSSHNLFEDLIIHWRSGRTEGIFDFVDKIFKDDEREIETANLRKMFGPERPAIISVTPLYEPSSDDFRTVRDDRFPPPGDKVIVSTKPQCPCCKGKGEV